MASAQQRPSQFEIWDLKLGTPIGEPSQFAVVLADQLGLYKKYGIDVRRFT